MDNNNALGDKELFFFSSYHDITLVFDKWRQT